MEQVGEAFEPFRISLFQMKSPLKCLFPGQRSRERTQRYGRHGQLTRTSSSTVTSSELRPLTAWLPRSTLTQANTLLSQPSRYLVGCGNCQQTSGSCGIFGSLTPPFRSRPKRIVDTDTADFVRHRKRFPDNIESASVIRRLLAETFPSITSGTRLSRKLFGNSSHVQELPAPTLSR